MPALTTKPPTPEIAPERSAEASVTERDRNADRRRHLRVGVDEAGVEAEAADIQQPPDHHREDERERQRPGEVRPAEGRQALDGLVLLGVREGAHRVLPRAVEQVEQEIERDVVEQQRRDDLVDAEAEFQERRDQDPEHAAERGRDQHQRQAERIRARYCGWRRRWRRSSRRSSGLRCRCSRTGPGRRRTALSPTTRSGAAWTSTADTLIGDEKIETMNSS